MARRYRPSLPLTAQLSPRGEDAGAADGDDVEDKPSFTFYCDAAEFVPPAYPPATITSVLTAFSNPDCTWDGLVQQFPLALNECSTILPSNGGLYHPMYVLLTSCGGGEATYAAFADAACMEPLGGATVPTTCSNSTGPPHTWGVIACTLP